jgi:hypothetical protein
LVPFAAGLLLATSFLYVLPGNIVNGLIIGLMLLMLMLDQPRRRLTCPKCGGLTRRVVGSPACEYECAACGVRWVSKFGCGAEPTRKQKSA